MAESIALKRAPRKLPDAKAFRGSTSNAGTCDVKTPINMNG